MTESTKKTLYYAHDPMCSWCWAFRPTWDRIVQGMPPDVMPRRILGGLAADSNLPMPAAMQRQIRDIWRLIQQRVPGTRFNFEFWDRCQPRRATYPACRAVIAARNQGEAYHEPMIRAIQQAYYLDARNPSDDATLAALARELGMDGEVFAVDLVSPDTQTQLEQEISLGRAIGVRGFPSLVLDVGGRYRTIDYDYLDPAVALAQI